MNSLTVLGKCLDQPRLVKKFSGAVPAILVAGGALYASDHVYKSPKETKKKEFVKSVFVLTGTIASALIASRGIRPIKLNGKIIFKGFKGLSHEHCHGHIHGHEHKHDELHEINEFIEKNPESKAVEILKKMTKDKKTHLSFNDVRTLLEEAEINKDLKELVDELIPNPENIDSKHIFGEIKRLSLIGLVPVLGGIAGGIAGDKVTGEDLKQTVPNKIKEGSYQYLANIFLCNVGAGAALFAMERANVTSKMPRAIGMITGIILAGVVFGSATANLIGRHVIDPLMGHKHTDNCLYCERTPEILDLGLHIDDVATVAVLSGLKWIEPALPILYSISGYRAGIGYRNHNSNKNN